MPLALTARFIIDPKGILADRWNHDMAHALVAARQEAAKGGQAPAPEPSEPR